MSASWELPDRLVSTPIDRFLYREFSCHQGADISRRVLRIGDDAYSRRFGGSGITHNKKCSTSMPTIGTPALSVI